MTVTRDQVRDLWERKHAAEVELAAASVEYEKLRTKANIAQFTKDQQFDIDLRYRTAAIASAEADKEYEDAVTDLAKAQLAAKPAPTWAAARAARLSDDNRRSDDRPNAGGAGVASRTTPSPDTPSTTPYPAYASDRPVNEVDAV